MGDLLIQQVLSVYYVASPFLCIEKDIVNKANRTLTVWKWGSSDNNKISKICAMLVSENLNEVRKLII